MAESTPMETNNTQKETTIDEKVESCDNKAGEVVKEGDKAASENEATGTFGRGQKREYTEEEKIKRKAFFKELRDKRLAKYKRRNQLLSKKQSNNAVKLSFHMSEEESKILDYYVTRLSVLKGENETLHTTLKGLVQENMKLLQMGPPMTSV